MQLRKKSLLIVTLSLVLALGIGTIAMAATGSLTKIENKWLDLQKLVTQKMVKEGRITQAQADEHLTQMEEHLRTSTEDDIYTHMSRRTGMRLGFTGIMADAWAELTGQDAQEIMQTCREEGTTVWQLAAQAGRQDELKEKVLTLCQDKLDTLVAEGRITKEQKDKILDGMKKRLGDEDFSSGFMGPRGCPGRRD